MEGGRVAKGKEVREVFGTQGEYPRYKEYCRLCTFFQDTVFPATSSTFFPPLPPPPQPPPSTTAIATPRHSFHLAVPPRELLTEAL